MDFRDLLALGKALADENRLRILAALHGRELCLCQLVELLGLANSTVSRHMSVLQQARLVEVRKAGRWSYFRLAEQELCPEVRRIRELLVELLGRVPRIQQDAARLRRVLEIDPEELCRHKHAAEKQSKSPLSAESPAPVPLQSRGDQTMSKLKVLFLCTGNSCRSQMAEGWARHLKSELIEPYSAGIETRGLNPLAVKVMAEAGVDISAQRSKHVDELRDVEFDYVVTVCDHARQSCPVFPGKARVIQVGFDDPPALAREAKTEEEALAHYRRVRDEIRALVEQLPEALKTRGAKQEEGG